jgi:hypothetical protein
MASAVKRHHPARLGLTGRALPSGVGCAALVFGEAALRRGRTVSAEAIQEHRMPLEDLCAALMRPGSTLVCPVRALRRWLATPLRPAPPRRGLLDSHAVRHLPAALREWAAQGDEQRTRDPTRSDVSVRPYGSVWLGAEALGARPSEQRDPQRRGIAPQKRVEWLSKAISPLLRSDFA